MTTTQIIIHELALEALSNAQIADHLGAQLDISDDTLHEVEHYLTRIMEAV